MLRTTKKWRGLWGGGEREKKAGSAEFIFCIKKMRTVGRDDKKRQLVVSQ